MEETLQNQMLVLPFCCVLIPKSHFLPLLMLNLPLLLQMVRLGIGLGLVNWVIYLVRTLASQEPAKLPASHPFCSTLAVFSSAENAHF